MTGKLQVYLVTLIRTDARAACEELISKSPTDGEVALAWGETFSDLGVVASKSVPPPAEGSGVNVTEKAMARLISYP